MRKLIVSLMAVALVGGPFSAFASAGQTVPSNGCELATALGFQNIKDCE